MRKILVLFITALLITLTSSCSDSADVVTNNTEENYSSFFEENKVIDLYITMPQAVWDNMVEDTDGKQFYNAGIEINGHVYESSGIRIKGALKSSKLQSLTRHSFKIKFNKYIKGQTLDGLDELNLINQYGDPSFMREYITLEAMRKSGMPAPLALYVNVYINGVLHGLYLGVETVDTSFLTRNFGDSLGNLYEAEDNGTLLPDMYSKAFTLKNGGDTTKDSLTQLTEMLDNMPYGEKGDIESILNVKSVLSYIAANNVFGNYDSYLGKNAKNYYLYQSNGIFTIIPCDVYTSFGAYQRDNGLSTDISPLKPLFEASMQDRPLVNKLLAVPEYEILYNQYVTEFIGYLREAENRIKELDSLISPYVEADPTKFYTFNYYKENLNGTGGNISILNYAKKRMEFLKSY